MKINLNAKHLKAALCVAAVNDIRYYLNGLLVEVQPTEIRVAATDGHCAAVFRTVDLVDGFGHLFEVIIPSDTVVLALAGKAQAIELECENSQWRLGPIQFTPIAGKFPDYRRIIPCKHSGEAAQFNVDLLGKFRKIGKALGHKGQPILRHNGSDCAQVQFYGDHDFIGALMPLRAFTEKMPDTGLEQWGHERT